MHQNKQKKSLGFLSVVAFLMIMVGVGYTVSSVFAVNGQKTLPETSQSPIPSSETSPQSPKENLFSSVEKQVAGKANSLRNELLGNAQSESVSATGNKNQNADEDNQNSLSDDTSSNAVAVLTLANIRPLPKVYDDIEHSVYKEAILTLYSHGLIQGGKNFYPDNYVRISDFIRVVMDTYRLQLWYDLNSLEGLTKNAYFSFNVPIEVLSRINSAYEWWFLIKLALEDTNGNSRLNTFISPAEAKEILLAMQKKSPALLKTLPEMHFASEETLLREEMAQLVVAAFWVKLNERSLPVFSDISWTTYQDAIQKLARLWILAWVDGKFYPDAKVENKDFVIMLVRTLVYRQGKPIVVDNFYYLKPLQNVSTTAAYAPYLEYCLELEVCNPLLSQTSWGVSFTADRLLSRSEIVPILSSVAKIKFDLPSARRWESLTRGELAHLFVRMFALDDTSVWSEVWSGSSNSLASSPTENKSDSKSRRETFQELMKIQ